MLRNNTKWTVPLAIDVGALVDPKLGHVDDVRREDLREQGEHQIQWGKPSDK